ncbi:MAG: TylF/MycF/NovP-related O-methyltransferase [Pseudomonadota bacterium]
MGLKSTVIAGLQKLPPRAFWTVMALLRPPRHFGDDLAMWNRDIPFERDAAFEAAYAESITFATPEVQQMDVRWRAYTACWAASVAAKLPGDFVECGVNTGLLSGTICRYLAFQTLEKSFWLFDTYEGIPAALASATERPNIDKYNAQYPDVWDVANRNFEAYPSAQLIRGMIPDSLHTVDINRVSYLSIDLNIAAPEKSALEHFWPKMTPSGLVLLDDYGFSRHAEQRKVADEFAADVGTKILPLATGQGLLFKN